MPLALLCAALLAQAPNPNLKAAREAMAELRYPEAKTLLAKARQQSGLSRAELLEILWMQGLVAASLNQPDAARTAFRALFAIDPEHKPERDYPPKIMSPYYEARGWVATNQALGFQALPAVLLNGRIRRIGVKILGDPLALVTGVRFHVQGMKTVEVDLKELQATRDVDADQVTWWAELIGERDARLAYVGDAKHPLVESAPRAEVTKAEQSSDPDVDAEIAAAHAEPPPGGPPRQVSYLVGGVGAGAFLVGLVFGIRSNTEANALKSRTYDSTGAVENWTQREAVLLELQQRREAGVANAMFVIASLAIATAVILFIVGHP